MIADVNSNRTVQRFPSGLAFEGKNLAALEAAFEAAFNSCRELLFESAKENKKFWELQANLERGNLSIEFIERKLAVAGFNSVKCYLCTCQRDYVAPPLTPRNVLFGNVTFGKCEKVRPRQYYGSLTFGNFNEGKNEDFPGCFGNFACMGNTERSEYIYKYILPLRKEIEKSKENTAFFGKMDDVRLSPKFYTYGKEINDGYIDHLLNTCNGDDAETQTVFNNLPNALKYRRFIYYVCGEGEFMENPINITSENLIKLKQTLLKRIQLGMFGILLIKITE